MKRTISFGYYNVYHKAYKNEIKVSLKLKDTDKGPVFTSSGDVWNRRHTNIKMGGQCLDKLMQYLGNNKLFIEIHRLWKLYHLNDMRTGTNTQEKLLKEYFAKNNKQYSYKEACDYLKGIGLFEVTMKDGSKYKYGHGWLYEPIPENDLEIIKSIINGTYKEE